jgi:hypothetical protein
MVKIDSEAGMTPPIKQAIAATGLDRSATPVKQSQGEKPPHGGNNPLPTACITKIRSVWTPGADERVALILMAWSHRGHPQAILVPNMPRAERTLDAIHA